MYENRKITLAIEISNIFHLVHILQYLRKYTCYHIVAPNVQKTNDIKMYVYSKSLFKNHVFNS